MIKKIMAVLLAFAVTAAMPFIAPERGHVHALVYNTESEAQLNVESVLNEENGLAELDATIRTSDIDDIMSSGRPAESGAVKICFSEEGGSGDAAAEAEKVRIRIEKNVLKRICEYDNMQLEIAACMGKVKISQKLMKYLLNNAKGDTVDVVMENVVLSEAEQKLCGADALARKMYFSSGGKQITNLKGISTEIELYVLSGGKTADDYSGAVRRLKSGKMVKPGYSVEEDSSMIRCKITDDYLGTFVVGEASQLSSARVAAGVKNTTLKLKLSRDKNSRTVDLKWTKSKGFNLDGYEVYHAFSKYGNYVKAYTTDETSCYNQNIMQGATKYYRVRGYREIGGRKYYTKWSNTVKISIE